MNFLFCCEFYHPSRGGVQEVMRQIAERMVLAGHRVTVATTRLAERTFDTFNGVRIVEFDVGGNRVSGMKGEIERYRRFLASFPAEAILIKAAQQWTFDASWEVLEEIRARKIFIPCGFSGLFEPAYEAYFEQMPAILRKFDHLIFYAERYRDIDFARAHGLRNISIVPNGASEVDFAVAPDPNFRSSLGIPADDFLILTVGAPVSAKGHAEVAAAFAELDANGQSMTLLLNGDWPAPADPPCAEPGREAFSGTAAERQAYVQRAVAVWRRDGTLGLIKRVAGYFYWRAVFRRRPSIDEWISRATRQRGKKVLKTRLSRVDTIQAFLAADLFVFASRVEYSPLVLFEAAAAGTPFLSVPVGNAEEIARWTGGGVICPASKDKRGYTDVSPRRLAKEMARLIADVGLRDKLGRQGRQAWTAKFNWKVIAETYESILTARTGKTLTDQKKGWALGR